MEAELVRLQKRIERLEAGGRRLRVSVLVAVLLAVGWAAVPGAQQSTVMRVRSLIVEDAQGRTRLQLGPLDPPPSTRGIGLRINDAAGAERIALYLTDAGHAGIGLDAPPGTGDDRNRERINITADEKGGSGIRFLDRRTSVAARMYLDDQNRVWMQFSDFSQTPASIRRYGLSGEEILRPPK